MGIKSTRLADLLWMFAAIDKNLYEQLLRSAYVQPIRPDQKVVCEGEIDDTVYVVASGELRVVRESDGGSELARLGPGDMFGEMALLESGPRTATVEAVGYAQVLRFDAGRISALLRDFPAFRSHLSRTSVRRQQANYGLPCQHAAG
jgi:CRP-like cAMP-binding protein